MYCCCCDNAPVSESLSPLSSGSAADIPPAHASNTTGGEEAGLCPRILSSSS